MKLHIDITGKGKPLVFLHGWGFNRTIWHNLIPHLKTHYQLYLVDLPGYGLSDYCKWSYESLHKNLTQLIGDKFTLIGWSLGGLIATEYALTYPENVSALINICSTPCFIKQNNWPGVDLAFFKRFSRQLKSNYDKTMSDFLALQLPDKKKDQFNSIIECCPALDALDDGLSSLLKTDLRHSLTQLSMPCYYLFGKMDKLAPASLEQHITFYSQDIKTHCFIKSAHMPFVSEPDEFSFLVKKVVK